MPPDAEAQGERRHRYNYRHRYRNWVRVFPRRRGVAMLDANLVEAPKLSRREREVAILVAQGLTNRQIAARLFISERTAESHVEQIRGKLGFHSRVEIANWVAAGLQGDGGPVADQPAAMPAEPLARGRFPIRVSRPVA